MVTGKTGQVNTCYLKIPCLILLLLLIPAVSHAATSGDYEYTDNGDGTCTITAYLGLGGDITIPDTLNGLTVSDIGPFAFYGRTDLTTVIAPESVSTLADSSFADCTSLSGIFFKGNAPVIGSDVFSGVDNATVYHLFDTTGWSDTYGGLPTSLWCTFLDNGDGTCTIMRCAFSGDIILPETLNGLTVTTIADDACAQCYGLTSLMIPQTVTNIEQGAFSPSALTNITVVPANPAYSSLEGVLFNKIQTELIRYPDRKTGDYTIPNSVTAIGHGAFGGCDDLTSVNIQDGVISIGDWAFANCSNLTGITVVPANPAYSSLDGVLFNKAQTELLQYPPGKAGEYTIPNSVTTIRDHAFYYCFDLTGTLTIPDSVTAIGDSAFFFCSGLTGLSIGNGVTTIGSFVFGRCEGVTHLMIGDSVTSIGENAFFVCDSLTSVIIPAGVTNIGYRGFYDCDSLTGVYFKGQPPALGTDVFRYVNATVYYIPGTAGWGEYYGGLPTSEWPPSPADADLNYEVDIYDFSVLAAHWLQTGCDASNDWCQWADFSQNGAVDLPDAVLLADDWLFGLVPF